MNDSASNGASRGAQPVPYLVAQPSPEPQCNERPQRIEQMLAPFQEFLPWGLIVLDADRRILFATPYARQLLSAECGLKTSAEKFQIERASVNRAIAELIRRAAMRRTGQEVGPVVVGAPDRQGRMRFALRVIPYEGEEDGSLVLVGIMDILRGGQIQRTKIAAIFGLSDREAELAELFSQGLRVQEIAAEMGVAVNTARVHLRNVFSKTGCANQIELARTFTMLPYFMGPSEHVTVRVVDE